jgi:1-acyl-sn-glycerol-3-phosphate acyltransferase
VAHFPFWFLEASRPLVRLAARGLFRIRFEGVEHVPPAGPVVITPNHVSYLDPILVSIPIHRALYYLALEPFFRVAGLGALMRWCRALPVREGEPNEQAARVALRLLRAGEPVMIFPEGGRSQDGWPRPFRPGAFRLALGTGTPVLPVTIRGGYEVWPAGRRLPRPGRITITYHPLMTSKDLPAGAPRRAQPELMAELVRGQIESALAARPPRSP